LSTVEYDPANGPVPLIRETVCDLIRSTTMNELDLERPLDGSSPDETDINLRAYLSRISDDKLRRYSTQWSDEQVIEWDGNFRSDRTLMLVCCERDVEIAEYRAVLEEHIRRRGLV
jgi:hypothetical protein